MRQILLLAVVAVGLGSVKGHMRWYEPVGRASLWRYPEQYGHLNPEVRANDDEFWCGSVFQFENDTRCGVCGDDIGQAQPRDNERGGRYWRDVRTKTYRSGQIIDIHLASNTQNHGGGMEIHLCAAQFESEACFQKLLLGNGDTFWPMTIADGTVNVETTAQLPPGVTCERCTLRAHYRGAQNWGTCDNSKTCMCQPNSGNPPGGLGCSEQQTFRNCADIEIV